MTPEQKVMFQKEAERISKRVQDITQNPKTLSPDFLQQLRTQPINLKESKCGQFEIKREIISAGKEITVISHRNWIMMGYKPLKVVFDKDRLLHKLLRNGQGLLMSDSPQEMFLQYDAYKNASGKVLVGGLGIGLYPSMISKKPDVSKIDIVEIDKDIIALTEKQFKKNPKIRIINDDIKHFLKTIEGENYDYCYIDIHYSTGAMTYIHSVLPLRKIIERKFPNMKTDFWGEEEMKSQYIGSDSYVGG